MNLSDVKNALEGLEEVNFHLPSGEKVAPHFHVTEVGQIDKHFIDCGGTIRKEAKISFQLFTANDHDHRLSAKKLKNIIRLSERKLELGDHEVEVEYQMESIGKFGLSFDGNAFWLTVKRTDCLAKDNCGIPEQKPQLQTSCAPGSGCC